MKDLVARRARIARVRNVQHLQAAAVAQASESHALQLERNAERLGTIRSAMAVEAGAMTGAMLANAGEIAMRLDQVREGLANAIVGARETAAQHAAVRLEARKKQESADKLDQRANEAFGRWIERRNNIARPRRSRGRGYEDQP